MLMHWLNLSVADIQSATFLGAEPVQRATWLCLTVYCAAQENGGVIYACHEWTDRKWQQVCGVTLEEVKSQCDLWFWHSDGSLQVWRYPVKQEELVKKRRAQAKPAAEYRWKTRKKNTDAPPKPRTRKKFEPHRSTHHEEEASPWNGSERH